MKLLQQGISEFYGDLVYRIYKNNCGEILIFRNNSESLLTVMKIGYNPYVMRQTAFLVINPTWVDIYVSLFNCTTAGRASDSVTAST